jgi:hypothetical protein
VGVPRARDRHGRESARGDVRIGRSHEGQTRRRPCACDEHDRDAHEDERDPRRDLGGAFDRDGRSIRSTRHDGILAWSATGWQLAACAALEQGLADYEKSRKSGARR